jgi:lipopolysaccharide export system permease protein
LLGQKKTAGMHTFDSYILRQSTRPLLTAVVVALLLLLVERMMRLLDFVLDSRGTLDVLLQLLTVLVPHYLGLALPAALFLALSIAFGRMQRDSELDAMLSAGFGLHQQIRPALTLAVILTAIAAVTFGFLQPYARYTYRSLIHELSHGPVNIYLREGLFIQVRDTTYMVESLDRDRRRFSRVFAYQVSEDESRSSAVTSRLASLTDIQGQTTSQLVLFDGVRLDLGLIERSNDEEADRPAYPSVAAFERTSIPVELKRADPFRPRGQDERELTLFELWSEREFPPLGLTRRLLEAEFHERAVRIVSMLVLPFFAVPLALGRKRSSRAPGLAFGILVLIAYNKLLDSGSFLATYAGFNPYLSIWGPLLLFTLVSAFLSARAAFGVGREGLFNTFVAGLWGVLRPMSRHTG